METCCQPKMSQGALDVEHKSRTVQRTTTHNLPEHSFVITMLLYINIYWTEDNSLFSQRMLAEWGSEPKQTGYLQAKCVIVIV